MSQPLYDRAAAARLRCALDRFPRAPVAHLPTPLDACPRLSAHLDGPRILMKRDDMTGLAFGGNKARQFSFSLGPAIQGGYDVLIHGSDSQSNQSRMTAAAAAKLGMQAYVVIPRDVRSYPTQGNLLLDHLLNAQVRYVFPGTGEDEKAKLIKQLKEEGRKPYDTSRDGAVLRAVAYVECVLELCEQLERLAVVPAAIYTSSRSYTIAGLTVGLRAVQAPVKAVAINYWVEPEKTLRDRLAPIANECADALDLGLSFEPDDFEVYGQYAKPDFSVLSQTSLDTLHLVARMEGILLDPVYTNKAMDGLIDHIKQGRFGREDAVVFIHTGGTPALFAFGDELFG